MSQHGTGRQVGVLVDRKGVVEFDPILESLSREELAHDWWTVDLCFWPDAWDATAACKTAMDGFVEKYG